MTTHEQIGNRNNGARGFVFAALLAATVLTSAPAALAQRLTGDLTSREEKIRSIISRASRHDHSDHEGHQHEAVENDPRCLELSGFSVMFDPGTSDEALADALDALPDDELPAFQPQGSVWTYTATNGTLTPGESFTITYSFVPDGTPITATGWGSGNSNLFAQMNASFPGGMNAFRQKVAAAFAQWSAVTNITYVEVSDDGATWGPFTVGALGIRGDVRIGMIPLGEPLAVNSYPQNGGDMILDSGDMGTFANSLNDFRSLRNVLTHEHGHGLGMKHVMPVNNTKLLEPFLSTNFDGPQEDDIRAAHFLYGDAAEYNDDAASNFWIDGELESPSQGVVTLDVTDVALERDGVSDWYGFGCDPGTPIAIRLSPKGTTYTHAPQENPQATTTVNAKAVRNLGLRLYTKTSVSSEHITLLAQIDFTPAGQDEYHPPVPYGNFGFGYMLVQVYSNDGINDVQEYTLTISNAAIEAPVESASMSVFNVQSGQEIFDGSTVQFGQVNIGSAVNRTLSIASGGPGTLEIGQITLAGPGAGDYSFTLLNGTIDAGDASNMAVTFAPTAPGVRQAVMTIPSNDPTQPNFSFILSGAAVQPAVAVMDVELDGADVVHNSTILMGDVELGDAAAVELTVRNAGNATLLITSVNFGGAAAAEYAATLINATLTPGASVTATVTFAPTFEGTRDAEMRLFNNSAQGLFIMRFSGTGVAAQQPPAADCNGNGTEDADDIADGVSADCNTNGTPDECETDSDNDGAIDGCDVCDGLDDTLDSDGNGTPDCQELVEQPQPGDDENPNDVDPVDTEDPIDVVIGGGACGAGTGGAAMMAAMGLCGAGLRVRRTTTRRRRSR